MTGWISLHRSIQDHWMFNEKRTFSKFEAWVDLLMMVNHKNNKVLLGSELVLVKRGQKITSLRKLSERWQWSITKVDRFLKLLESDEMITVKKDSKKTVVSIVNYDIYQNQDLEKRHKKDSGETLTIQEEDAGDTRTKTNNNDDNGNNDLITKNNVEEVRGVYDYYEQNGFGQVPSHLYTKVDEWMNQLGFSPEMIIKAMEQAVENDGMTINYIHKILMNWRNKKITTVEQVDVEERKRAATKLKGRNNSNFNSPSRDTSRQERQIAEMNARLEEDAKTGYIPF